MGAEATCTIYRGSYSTMGEDVLLIMSVFKLTMTSRSSPTREANNIAFVVATLALTLSFVITKSPTCAQYWTHQELWLQHQE